MACVRPCKRVEWTRTTETVNPLWSDFWPIGHCHMFSTHLLVFAACCNTFVHWTRSSVLFISIHRGDDSSCCAHRTYDSTFQIISIYLSVVFNWLAFISISQKINKIDTSLVLRTNMVWLFRVLKIRLIKIHKTMWINSRAT